MPNVQQLRERISQLREDLALVDKKRAEFVAALDEKCAAIVEAIQNGEDLINKMERARPKQ